MPETQLSAQSFSSLDSTHPGITELEDGGALVDLESESGDFSTEGDFYSNLAESLDDFKLNSIASDLLELIEKDKEARKERDRAQEEGIRRTGLGNDAPGGATFDGASKVVHPVLAEGCVDFSARAIKELFPSNGPVRTKIIGESNDETLAKARKKRDFLNWYLVEKMPEYRSEKEVLLTQLPLGGSQYEKYTFNGTRVCMEFVPIDKVFLPYAANSFYTTSRLTNEQEKTEEKIQQMVDSGFYVDVFGMVDEDIEETASQKATNKIEGKSDTGYNEDGVRVIYEVSCNWDVEGEVKPYVIHIDEPSGKIAAIYRNWREDDEHCERLDWWVEDKFLPWRGAYGIGLPHLIGGLAASLTGALRALLDSAHINNAPTAIKLKGGRSSGQNVSMDITAVTEIEAPAGVDDIRKIMMPMPFNPPSQVLFQLMDWLTAQAKGVVTTAEEKIADVRGDMPVGTTLALIEQGSQVFSSIHARLHDSQRKALKIICRLIHDYPDHALQDMQRFGLTAEDFATTDDVEPISDPNIFSETQRFAQMQSVMQLASGDAQNPNIKWNQLALRRRMLELLRVDGIDELLPKEVKPLTSDPMSEADAAMKGQPILANVQQDHIAHIHGHVAYLSSPFVIQNPLVPAQPLMAILSHIQEHINLFAQQIVHEVSQQILMLAQQHGRQITPDEAVAAGIAQAQENMGKQLGKIMPQIMQLQQQIQQKMPQPQMPPEITASLQIAKMDTDRKAQYDQASLQIKQSEVQAAQAKSQAEMQMQQQNEMMQQQMAAAAMKFEQMIESQKLAMENQQKHLEGQLSMMKNDADNRQHMMTELLKNRDDNKTTLQVEAMKLHHATLDSQLPDITQVMDQLSSVIPEGISSAIEDASRNMQGVAVSSPPQVLTDAMGNPVGVAQSQQVIGHGEI